MEKSSTRIKEKTQLIRQRALQKVNSLKSDSTDSDVAPEEHYISTSAQPMCRSEIGTAVIRKRLETAENDRLRGTERSEATSDSDVIWKPPRKDSPPVSSVNNMDIRTKASSQHDANLEESSVKTNLNLKPKLDSTKNDGLLKNSSLNRESTKCPVVFIRSTKRRVDSTDSTYHKRKAKASNEEQNSTDFNSQSSTYLDHNTSSDGDTRNGVTSTGVSNQTKTAPLSRCVKDSDSSGTSHKSLFRSAVYAVKALNRLKWNFTPLDMDNTQHDNGSCEQMDSSMGIGHQSMETSQTPTEMEQRGSEMSGSFCDTRSETMEDDSNADTDSMSTDEDDSSLDSETDTSATQSPVELKPMTKEEMIDTLMMCFITNKI